MEHFSYFIDAIGEESDIPFQETSFQNSCWYVNDGVPSSLKLDEKTPEEVYDELEKVSLILFWSFCEIARYFCLKALFWTRQTSWILRPRV